MEDASAKDAQKGPELADSSTAPTKKQNVFTFLRQFLIHFYPRILLVVVFILAMVLSNATGLLYAATTIISLVLEQKNNWRYVYVSYMMISVAAVVGQIYFLIDSSPNQEAADISSWFGLALIFDKVAVRMLLINISILLLSILGMIVSLWKNDILSDEEYKQTSEKYRPILRTKSAHATQAEKGDVSDDDSDKLLSIEDISAEDKEQLRSDFEFIKARYRYKKFDRALSDLYHVHGYELSLFVLLIVAFYRLNVVSIVHVLITWYFSFSCKYFYDQQRYAKNLRNLKWAWRVLYSFLSLDLMRQYFFLIWFPLSWHIPRLFENADFGCDLGAKRSYSRVYPFSSTSDYDKCITNWREWLSLDSFSSGELIVNFINVLMFVNYDKYFTAYVSFRPEEHSPGDEKDFTDSRRRTFLRDVKFLYYCHFFFVPLVLFVLIGVKDGITGQTDVISCLYFFMGLYFIFDYKKLLKKRNRIWSAIETVNNLVLLLIVCFQVPIIPCPLALEDRYYYSMDECITLQTMYNAKHQNSLNEINNPVVWYNIIDIVGINKVSQLSFSSSYKEILMILFYFIAFIQRKIWNHGYINAYVIPYYQKKSKYNYEIAAMYVEQVHFVKKAVHSGLLMDEEITKYHEKKLDGKLKEWEKLFKVELRTDEMERSIEDEEEGTSRKDKALAIAEKVLLKVPETKIISIDALVELAERCEYDEERMINEIYIEFENARQDMVSDIREIKKINLPRQMKGRLLAKSGSVYLDPTQLDAELRKEPAGEEEEQEGQEEEEEEWKEGQEEEGEEKKEPEAPKEQEIVENKEEDKLVPEEDRERPSPVKYSSGGYFKHEGHVPLKYDAEKEKDFKYQIKKILVSMSQGSSFISDKRIIATPDDNFLFLLIQIFAMHIEKVTFFVFIMNFILNVNLLALVFPLSILFYGAIEFPVPTRGYWKGMLIYTIVVLFLKFIYQLPFFCGTPTFSFNDIFDIETYNCTIHYGDPWYLPFRIDYIIGIRKFTGDSSYPVNQGLFRGVIWDLLSLLCLLGVRSMLDSRGIWNHMRIYRSFKYVPQLEDKPKKKKSQYGQNGQVESTLENDQVETNQRRENKKNEPKGVKKYIRNMFSLNPFAVGSTLVRKPGYDYYKYLAVLSLIILVYFLLFFSAMVGSSKRITEEISKSNFSGEVVLAVIFIILVMIVERALYVMRENYFQAEKRLQNPDEEDREDLGDDVEQVVLSKPFFWKIVTHYFLVVCVHVFFFLVMLNGLAQENVNNFGAIAVGYILCAIYLFISALQIKYGYTLDIQTTFFNTTDTPTKLLFKVYRAVPFLFEITSILDWTALKTALDLFSWMKLEDARANLYLVKCEMEGRKKHAIGQAQSKTDKFLFGFCLGFILIFLIILPLLMFSTLNPDQQYNNVTGGSVALQFYASGENINNEITIYEVNNLVVKPVTAEDFAYLQGANEGLEDYDMQQLQKVEISTFSEEQWLISPPSLQLLQDFLADSTVDVYITFTWKFTRSAETATVEGSNSRLLSADNQQEIYDMLDSTATGQSASTLVLNLFPKFLGLSRNSYTELLGPNYYTEQGNAFSGDAELSYVNDAQGKYWTLESSTENDQYEEPVYKGNKVVMVLVSDKTMGSLLSSLGSLGLVGFYVTVVLAVGRLVRTLFEKTSQRVIYEEMPEPDDLIDLCNAILIARRKENLVKEEELYLTLIRIYRSPEMLLKLTGSRLKDQAKLEE